MRYLKKYNEELKPSTYMSASRKLAKLGHTDRAERLKDYSYEVESREELIRWRDHLQDYSQFGTFNISITNGSKKLKGDFALFIQFDQDAFEDSFEYEKEQNPNHIKDVSFVFFIGIIPTSEDLIKRCKEVMPDPEIYNGFFWGMVAAFNFEVINNKVVIKSFNLDEYDNSLTGNVCFADRASAHKFKMLMKNILSNPDLYYPSGFNDVEYMYQKLEQSILSSLSFSSEYGFQLQEIADFISKVSPNELYKSV